MDAGGAADGAGAALRSGVLEHPRRLALAVFLLALVVSAVLVLRSEQADRRERRAAVHVGVHDKAHAVQGFINHALSATHALAGLVRQGRGKVEDFELVARSMLPHYPGVAALQLAPQAVIRHIVPLEGNEGALGHDLFADPARNVEAFFARDTGRLTLAGPFNLLQGGQGAVGRLPIYLPDADGELRFWGFASALLRFPDILQAAHLERLERQGLRYALWRIKPDSGERQILQGSDGHELADPVSAQISLPSGDWVLSAEPVGGWLNAGALALKALVAVMASALLGWMTHRWVGLRTREEVLQTLVAQRTAALSEREADLNRAQSVARIGSWTIDLTSGRVHWSAETRRMFGVPADADVDLTRFLDCVHADDRARVEAAWVAALAGAPYDIEHRIQVGERVLWVRERAEIEFDADGQPLRGVGTVQDVTAAHEAAAQLRKLSTAVAFSPASIVITDRSGAIEYVNPQFELASGYSLAEVRGQNPRILKSGNRSPEEYARMWQTITAGEVWRGDFQNVRKGGGHYWESAAIAPLRDENGEISGFVAVNEDITQRRAAEVLLRESRARLAALVESLPDTLFVLDRSGCFVEYRCPQPELLLAPPEHFLGLSYAECLPPAVSRRIDAAIAAIEGGDSPQQIEYAQALPDGVRHFNASLSALPGPDGALAGVIALVRDVTERRRDAEALRQAMVVFRASSQGIMTTDAQGVITSVNPAFCSITGFSAEEVIGERSSIFKSGRHEPAFFADMWGRLAEFGAWEGEIWNRRRNGETYPQWLTITAVRNAEGEVVEYVSLFSDITERKRQEEAIWHQANFDPLTGLANRSLLQDRLERAIAHARRHGCRVGLMFIDLDGFKWINDSLGHDVGDALLVEVARRLMGCVREQDTVARLGGDEFTVVIGDFAESDVLHLIAEKLIHALREPFLLGNTRHHVSGSIGITVFPEDGGDVQALLRNADIAMYKAKQAGKNRAQFYAHHMQADALARLKVEADLRMAVDEGHFALHYQPIVEAHSGRLVGAEALLRWRHPELGNIPPGDFIPVAEDCGLIVPIGEWALREALRQARAWRDAGYPALRLSVNVSGVQFREPGLPELVGALLEDSRLTRDDLMLEITESVLMDSSDAAEARMHAVRTHGIGYALDDFGTGFSSLSYLKRFPVDSVKIDRSFVRDCPQDASDASLVEAIINMAHSLELKVTAEGVETVEQLDFLRGLGCDLIQGYLIGRPMAAEEFEMQLGPLWTLETAERSPVTS